MIGQRSDIRLESSFDGSRSASRRGAPAESPALTTREREVLELVAEGCSTREIARALWVTEETVKTHVRRVLQRLGARTRAQAVAIAYRDDLWTERSAEEAGEPVERSTHEA
jgi:DNA-binding CsgD family transcriptional regulator